MQKFHIGVLMDNLSLDGGAHGGDDTASVAQVMGSEDLLHQVLSYLHAPEETIVVLGVSKLWKAVAK